MRILFAEDDRVSAKLVTRTLEKLGHEVIYAPDGDTAWRILTQEDPPRLALLDWMMPGIEGPEICRRLRADPKISFIHTIILTGKVETADLVSALDAGADDYITKPFHPEELRARINTGARIVDAHRRLEIMNLLLGGQIKDRTEQLEHALRLAEQSSNAKSSFLANMSHEIRTPLNGIVSYVELLLYSELTEEQRADLETIKNSAASLQTIINDVLDFSKIEADRMVLERAEFSVAGVTTDVVELLRLKAEESSLAVVTEIDARVPKMAVGDRVRVQQILTNIIGNAIKFCSPKGGIVIHVSVDEQTENCSTIHFAVADSGIGIPGDQQANLFNSFVQADTSTTRKFGGTGLGLAISKRLTELMNGRIWFRSRVGIGTAFHFTIPFDHAVRQIANTTPTTKTAFKSRERIASGRRLLLAEDNVVNLNGMARVLTHCGFQVTTASDGREVLNLLDEHTFDIVLLDIQMPTLSGEAAFSEIRANPKTKTLPVVALTAHNVAGDREKYLQQGFTGYAAKPINYDALVKTIDAALQLKPNVGGEP